MNTKELANGVRRLRGDAVVCEIYKQINDEITKTFFNPRSTPEELKAAHDLVRAFNQIENRLNTILGNEVVADKKGDQERG